MDKLGYVYILCSKRNGTLYIGVTSDLKKRIWQHKNKVVKGFTENTELISFVIMKFVQICFLQLDEKKN